MAENDVNVEEKTLNDESRLSLLNDALDQASHKVINKILRYLVVWENICLTGINDWSFIRNLVKRHLQNVCRL